MKSWSILLCALTVLSQRMTAQRSQDIAAYINNYRDLAITEMQRSGIPASIILAQGIHETEAGTSELVKKSNNHFGIKCKDSWTGSVVYHDDDQRGECFRRYDSPQDSYKDHSDFLLSSPRYSFLFKLDPMDYHGWAYGLKKAGYATNTHYSQILIKLIEDYNLQQYTMMGMQKMKTFQTAGSRSPGERIESSPNSPVAGPPNYQSNASKYPAGKFIINRTSVVFIKAGTALLSLASQFDIPLSRLEDFNDLDQGDILQKDQLIYLQRKRKVGENEFHIVVRGESLHDICQTEGIRYESLLQLNRLDKGMEVAGGEKLHLQIQAPVRPALVAINNDHAPASAIATQTTPSPLIHVVQKKETLISISQQYGVEVEKIKQWNNLSAMSLKTGQQLVIYK